MEPAQKNKLHLNMPNLDLEIPSIRGLVTVPGDTVAVRRHSGGESGARRAEGDPHPVAVTRLRIGIVPAPVLIPHEGQFLPEGLGASGRAAASVSCNGRGPRRAVPAPLIARVSGANVPLPLGDSFLELPLGGLELGLLPRQDVLEHLGGGRSPPHPPQGVGIVPSPGHAGLVHVDPVGVGPRQPRHPRVGIAPTEGLIVPDDDEGPSGAGKGDVDATPVADEADGTVVVGTHSRKDDRLLLSSLEAVGGRHLNEGRAA
mmetsp:Transcript_36002/g.107680  ORF Transcript_36002/g.107680 Transcript_36002/m.107680 type:complete len:259 (+) Transcript_36002:293-1069(+)